MATLLSNLCMFIYVPCVLVARGSVKMSFTCLITPGLLIKPRQCVFEPVNKQCWMKNDPPNLNKTSILWMDVVCKK